jgi:HAD superfamily hydrolase (TIGR01490 family)
MTEPQKVAVFDIDGTIFRSSLFIEVVEACIEKGLFPEEAHSAYDKEYEAWRNRNGSYKAYISGVVEAYMAHIKGVYYGDFIETAREVVEQQKLRTYRYTRDLIKTFKEQGYFMLVISHSQKAVLDLFCTDMGFDKVYGMMYEIGPSDRFTGNVTDEAFMLNKGSVLKRAIEKHNLTLKDSIGVGDTESDISFLDLVENPICFNPNSGLYQYAKTKDWKVVVERKDVIYEL